MANFWDADPVADTSQGGSDGSRYADAISGIESGGHYNLVGPPTRTGDRALGKYQVMAANVPEWTKAALGKSLTPQQFLASPEAQDAVFQHQFGQYVKKYGPEGAARAWFAGEGGMNDPNRRDALGTSVAGYANKFNRALGFAGQPQIPAGLPAAITTGQQPAQVSQDGGNWWDADPVAGQEGPTVSPSASGRPRVVIDTSPKPFADRFDTTGSQPANAQELQAGLVNRGAQLTAQPRDNFAQILTDFENQGSAAGQRTTPNIGAQSKNLISANVLEGDDGNAYYIDPASGKMLPTDNNSQVVLRDPADGRLKVFARTDSTNEGLLSAAGRMLGTGLATGAPLTRAVGPAVEAVEAAPSPGRQVVEASQRLGIDVPRAIASDSTAVQRIGQGIRNIPVVGDAIPRATQQLTDDLGGAVQRVAGDFGQGSGPNVANRIGNTLGDAAQRETQAAVDSARRTDEAAQTAFEQSQRTGAQALDATDAQSLQAARQAVGDLSPQDMGQLITARLRAGEQAARARKDQLYNIASQSDAAVSADAVGGARARVAQALEDDGRVIDGILTPASSRMLDELQRFSGMNIENRAVGARLPTPAGEAPVRAAVSMQGVEQVRKRLNGLSRAATNDADRSAARAIIREFDDWLNDSFDNALFSGSDEALNAFREARAANADWRTRFGFNARDDADRIVNRIATGEVTPQEVSNWLVGASKIGSKGVSSRLLTRIAEATGGDPEAMQAIRGGIWNRLSQSTGGVDAKASAKVANDINEFLNGSGRDVANRLFTPEQRGIMSAYADTLRRTEAAREHLAEAGKITKPTLTQVRPGPMQELADTVLGRNGRTDEALFSAINSYAKSGSRGDVQTLARLMKAIPPQDRGDLAGSIIRQIGISPRTGQFSPDVFVSQWQTYTPQAKTLLFGNAGAQRQALDDIATVSERMKQIGNRFGNPSGTAQNAGGIALGSSAVGAIVSLFSGNPLPALTLLSGVVGGGTAAKILASPAGAVSAAKWTRAYSALRMAPSAQRLAAFEMASRNLANTAGVSVSAMDFLRAIQSPTAGHADNEQPQIPRRVSQ